jgi:hypothetical protein
MADRDFVVKNGLVVGGLQISIGNTTVNAFINSTAFYVTNTTVNFAFISPTSEQKSATNFFLNANGSWTSVTADGGSYFKGNLGTSGDENNKGNLYRINANTQTANVTIIAGENTVVAGPLLIDTDKNLTVESGGRVVVV